MKQSSSMKQTKKGSGSLLEDTIIKLHDYSTILGVVRRNGSTQYHLKNIKDKKAVKSILLDYLFFTKGYDLIIKECKKKTIYIVYSEFLEWEV